ncbi:MAG: isochorismatase family protein [Nitrosomonas sp. PRO4]|nr:isochorismatase family protein [Nitrosomonas sp. PRO4]
MPIQLKRGDALIIVDVQNDFLAGGRLAVAEGNTIIPVLNRYIACFQARQLPIFATRDWHPSDHCSFLTQGGEWPPHCIAGSAGAAFHADLTLPDNTHIISKAISQDMDAYSGFTATQLDELLQKFHIDRVFIGGIATEYCVRNTVTDALQLGYCTFVLEDAIQAINQKIQDGRLALLDMVRHGAQLLHFQELTQ